MNCEFGRQWRVSVVEPLFATRPLRDFGIERLKWPCQIPLPSSVILFLPPRSIRHEASLKLSLSLSPGSQVEDMFWRARTDASHPSRVESVGPEEEICGGEHRRPVAGRLGRFGSSGESPSHPKFRHQRRGLLPNQHREEKLTPDRMACFPAVPIPFSSTVVRTAPRSRLRVEASPVSPRA